MSLISEDFKYIYLSVPLEDYAQLVKLIKVYEKNTKTKSEKTITLEIVDESDVPYADDYLVIDDDLNNDS